MTKKDAKRIVFIDEHTASLLKRYIETNRVEIEAREKEFNRLVDERKTELDELITGKNKAKEVRKQLRAYIRTLRSPVWNVSYRQIHRIIHNLGKKAGISKTVHPHVLRYAYAQRLADSDGNADLISIQTLMGHSNISTTRGYIFYNKRKAREMYDKAMSKKKGD